MYNCCLVWFFDTYFHTDMADLYENFTDKNILDESYKLVKHFPDFSLWEYRIA